MIGYRLREQLCSRVGAPAALGGAAAVAGFLAIKGIDPIGWADGLDSTPRVQIVDGAVVAVLLLGLASLLVLVCRVRSLAVEVIRRRRGEDGAQALAVQDALTGLPNRRVLKKGIEKALTGIWPGLGIAVLLIDLDGFKSVNDIYGHNVGDAVLRVAAERMKSALSFGTMLVRLAGDEFAVLVPYSLHHRAQLEAEAIVNALNAEISVLGVAVSIGASVGVARAPADAGDALSLLWAADVAMYHSKAAGGRRATLFEPKMGQVVREEARFKSELRGAIDSDQIVPYYQPVIDLRSGRIAEFEVLARWLHPDKGVVTPDRFLAIVDGARLATPMLVSLIRQLARDAADWPPDVRFSLNLFASQLSEANLIDVICGTAEAEGLPPSRLCLEVTETAQVKDIDAARRTMEAAHRAGMTLALDDVGTGYSSLQHLRLLPFDRMKIDSSFVLSVALDGSNAPYLDILMTAAKKLGLKTVAEGIETSELDRMTTDMRCDYGQGYFYSRPVPAAEVPAVLARNGAGAKVLPMVARSAG